MFLRRQLDKVLVQVDFYASESGLGNLLPYVQDPVIFKRKLCLSRVGMSNALDIQQVAALTQNFFQLGNKFALGCIERINSSVFRIDPCASNR